MQKIIIADTSCLILLNKIGELEILSKLFKEIIITSLIKKEFNEPLPKWIKVINPKSHKKQKELELIIDSGEASALSLALEFKGSLLILDDMKARKLALSLGLKITGTLGVLVEAKQTKVIPEIKFILSKIRKTNFRIDEEIEIKILKICGEKK
jgi:predicted nucleic acid-binding protein